MNYCIEYGDKAKYIFEPNRILDDSFYVRAKYNHLIANYIPIGNELNNIKTGHKVHMFVTNMSLMQIITMLSFIKEAYKRSKRKVIIHVPAADDIIIKCVTSACWLYDRDINGMYKIYRMRAGDNWMTFIYRDNDWKECARSVQIWISSQRPVTIHCISATLIGGD